MTRRVLGASSGRGTIYVDTDTFHHELHELPREEEADFLALSTELRVFDDYPIDVVDQSIRGDDVQVVADTIVEFNRDGTVVRELSLFEVFDTERQVYDSTAGFWNQSYPAPTLDWTHGNSVILDPSDHTYIISMRHQDAVAKITRDSGEVVWILGSHQRWKEPWSDYLLTPIGDDFEWQFHQHAPEINLAGNLVLFDNGNHRAIPPNPSKPVEEWYSRAVEFEIDEKDMTVRQPWVWTGAYPSPGGASVNAGVRPSPLLWNSWFLGDADPLPLTGNVLVTDGGKREGARNFGRLAEVTHEATPRIVFEVVIEDPTRAVGWAVYRSERVADIRAR